MNTKFTDDEWLLIFQQRTQSGLSVRKWCDSNQISYDKYKYWEKKLLRRSDPERAVSPMDFVELPQALLPPLSLEQEQSYPFELSFHGLHLKIASHAQPFQFFLAERMGDTPLFILFQYWRRKDVRLAVSVEVLDKKCFLSSTFP